MQVWSVRQGCASELSLLAQQLPREALRDRLLPLWEALVSDVSAWAKAAARRQAGLLLTIVHPDDCPDGGLPTCSESAALLGCLLMSCWAAPFRCARVARHCGCSTHGICQDLVMALTPSLLLLLPLPLAAALLECFLQAASGPVTLTEASAHYLPSVLCNLGVDRWPQLRWGPVPDEQLASALVSPCLRVSTCLNSSVALLEQPRGPAC